MDKNFSVCFALAASAALASSPGSAVAQSYPGQPIRFIVPYAAGGGVDIVARVD